MSQDFAKQRQAPVRSRQAAARAATRTSEVTKSTHWGWFVSGIFSGFLIVGIGYLGIIKLDSEITEASQAATNNSQTPSRPTFDFGFYDELANTEVEVNVGQAPGIAATEGAVQGRETTESAIQTQAMAQVAQPEDDIRYLLQAGSFQDRLDAENRRAKIILLNMDANIAPGVVSGKTWYRVQAGPFKGRRAVEGAQDILSENNIDSMRLKIAPSP